MKDERRHPIQDLPTGATKELFRLLVESVADYAIIMLDPRGKVLTWNTGVERIAGYRAEEIVGRAFACFYTSEDRSRHKPEQALIRAAADGRCEDEGFRVRKDGSRFWANVVVTPLRDGQSILLGFAQVMRDLTERRRVQEELEHRVAERTEQLAQLNDELTRVNDALVGQVEERRRAEAELRGILAAFACAVEGISFLDAEGRHVRANKTYASMLGFAPEELDGLPWEGIVWLSDREAARGAHARMLDSGRSEVDVRVVRKEATTFQAHMVLVRTNDATGQFAGHYCFVTDVSDRRR